CRSCLSLPASSSSSLSLHDALPIWAIALGELAGEVRVVVLELDEAGVVDGEGDGRPEIGDGLVGRQRAEVQEGRADRRGEEGVRSEEHTSELQSRFEIVCRLLLAKK